MGQFWLCASSQKPEVLGCFCFEIKCYAMLGNQCYFSCVLPRKDVRGLLAGLTKEKGNGAIDSAYSLYSSHWGSIPDPELMKKTVADIETDFLFLVPTQNALQLHANNTRLVPIGPGSRMGGLLFCLMFKN